MKRDLDCHFELETTKDKKFGFLVVIDEMQIDEDKEKPYSENQKELTVNNHRCSSDYVQFGRDSFVVTTKTSQKFCGDFEQVKTLPLAAMKLYLPRSRQDVQCFSRA